jgi:UDP-glucose 4-epimerase
VYVGDVVTANLHASELEVPPGNGLDDAAFNVGTGVETSVNGLADALERASETRTERRMREARKGELRNSALDASRLESTGWAPRVSLEEGLLRTYRWIADGA